jgi:hypothetical protein
VALLHRIVDTMVDNYRPRSRRSKPSDKLENLAFTGHEQIVRRSSA